MQENPKPEEEKTFDVLRRPDIDTMLEKLKDITTVKSSVNFRNGPEMVPDIVTTYEKIKCLESNGWEFEEFVLALEKRAILAQVDEYNRDRFPSDLLNRVRKFYPNAVFLEARIELE